MLCNKCKFKTTDPKLMSKHFKTKHKLEISEYNFKNLGDDSIKERPVVENLRDLYSEEYQKLKSRLIECAICNHEELKEDISKEELDKILIIKSRHMGLRKEEKGYFGEKEPKWVCEDCEKRNKVRIKHWDFVEKLIKNEQEKWDEQCKSEGDLIDKSIFDSGEWDECNFQLTLTKKIKGKKDKEYFFFDVWYDSADFSYNSDKKDKEKYFTLEEVRDIKKKAKELFKQITTANSEISNKYNKEVGVTEVEVEEYGITYRKDFASYEDGIGVLVVLAHPEGEEDPEVREIKDIDLTKFGGYIIETFITDDKSIYEYIWKENTKSSNPLEIQETPKKLIAVSSYHNNFDKDPFNLIEKKNEQATNLRKLFTNELYETEVIFGYKEFKFFKDISWRKKDSEYCLQHRKEREHKPYSNKIDIQSHDVIGFIGIFEKQIEWLNKINKSIVLPSKINKVGENSRHIILDKSKGLNAFGGYSCGEYPSVEEVKIKYEKGRITITNRDRYEKDVNF